MQNCSVAVPFQHVLGEKLNKFILQCSGDLNSEPLNINQGCSLKSERAFVRTKEYSSILVYHFLQHADHFGPNFYPYHPPRHNGKLTI